MDDTEFRAVSESIRSLAMLARALPLEEYAEHAKNQIIRMQGDGWGTTIHKLHTLRDCANQLSMFNKAAIEMRAACGIK